MTGFPTVHEYPGLLRLIAQRPRQAAMIFVRVRKHDAPDVRNRDARMPQSCAQSVDGFFGFRSCVNQSNGIFFDEIDVDGADVEGGGKGDGDDFHSEFQISNLKFEIHACRLRICSSSVRNSSRSWRCLSTRRD